MDRETVKEKLEAEIRCEQQAQQIREEFKCEGIDCQWCSEKEPCIYKIVNKQTEIIEQTTKQYEALQKQYISVLNLIKERAKNESLETKTI